MKFQINFKTIKRYFPLSVAILVLGACEKSYKDDNPYAGEDTPLQASFTVTSVQGNSNKFVITNTTPGECIGARWDIGKGAGFAMGKMSDTIFYPDAGTYTIKMQALTKKAGLYEAAPKTLTIANSDPAFGNMVRGGKMQPGDEANWTVAKLNSTNEYTWTLADGKYTVKGSSSAWASTAIYQAIQVEAFKKYQFSALVSGSGASDTWYEVYFGTTVPGSGDYTSGGNQIGLNTWNNCGKTAFSGNLATIGCSGTLVGKNGVITFPQSGTIYLVIKAGAGGSLGSAGISITNVELRGI